MDDKTAEAAAKKAADEAAQKAEEATAAKKATDEAVEKAPAVKALTKKRTRGDKNQVDSESEGEPEIKVQKLSAPTSAVVVEVEIEEHSDDDFEERPDDLTFEKPESTTKDKLFNVSELASAFPLNVSEWKGVRFQGIFVKSERTKQRAGKGANRTTIYNILVITIGSLEDQFQRVRVAVWDSAIENFRKINPKINDHLIFENVTIKKLDAEVATKFNLIGLEINCNWKDNSLTTYRKEVNLMAAERVKFWRFDELTIAQSYEEISFRASVVAKETQTAKLKTILIKQKTSSGNRTETINVWKEETKEWNPFFEQAIIGEFYTFQGIKTRVNVVKINNQEKTELSFSVSEFSRFVLNKKKV